MKALIKTLILTSASIIFVIFFYILFLREFATKTFCQRKINALSLNYKLSINFTNNSEEQKYIDEIAKNIYKNCLKSEGL